MSNIVEFSLGGLSCMTAAMVTHPIDTIKVRLQLNTSSKSNAMQFSSLWKGLSASLLREASYSTIRMGLYPVIKKMVTPTNDNSIKYKILSGAGSGMIGASIANPADLIKVILQQTGHMNQSISRTVGEIIRNDGIKGLYRGVGPTTSRAAILTATQLPVYDTAKQYLLFTQDDNIYTHIVASMVAGFACATTTSPIDVIKSRMMAMNSNGYGSIWGSLGVIVRGEGISSLYKGWTANFLRIGPHTIVYFSLIKDICCAGAA